MQIGARLLVSKTLGRPRQVGYLQDPDEVGVSGAVDEEWVFRGPCKDHLLCNLTDCQAR